MLGAAAGGATSGGGGPGPGPGPTGPPTNASTYQAGDEMSPETGVQWTNADTSASTGIGFSSSSSSDPSSNFGSVSPGATNFETGDATSGRFWYVRHQRNGQSSVWVLAGEGFSS